MFVNRNYTNYSPKKKSNITIICRDLFSKQFPKQDLQQLPILFVDAILHIGQMYCPLYHSSLLEFLQVLRKGAFGNRYHLRHISMETTFLLQQHLHDSHTYRMAQCLCKTSYLFLPCRQLFLVIHPMGISNYCSQNYELFFICKTIT